MMLKAAFDAPGTKPMDTAVGSIPLWLKNCRLRLVGGGVVMAFLLADLWGEPLNLHGCMHKTFARGWL